ncbi:MAG: hypothetical protein AAGA48_14170 [Myxococcota bacterium]
MSKRSLTIVAATLALAVPAVAFASVALNVDVSSTCFMSGLASFFSCH